MTVANLAHLKRKPDIGVHDASDCPHLVHHLLPRSALLPHDVGNGKSCAAGDALVAVDQDLPICSQCLLQFSCCLAQYAIAGTLLEESVTGNMGALHGSHQYFITAISYCWQSNRGSLIITLGGGGLVVII